jgi:hypothetical protein
MRLSPAAVAFAALLAVGLVATPAAAAVEPTADDAEEAVELYNENVDEVPDFIRDRFADERVVVRVERTGEADVVYTAETDEDARVVAFEEGEHDPTLRVVTDEKTIREVADAENPRVAAMNAYESDDVSVEGVGFTDSLRVALAEIGHEIASALGLA